MPHPADHDHAGHGHHGHAHGPGGHSHAPASFGRAFALGIALNAGFVVAEAVFGLLGHSMALLADAGHNLSDVLGLAVAGGAHALTRRAPTRRFTYGFGSSSILAALFNAVFLLVVVGGLSWEAILRFAQPEPVAPWTVMAVAAAGIAVNGGCALLFAAGRHGDLNLRGAFVHMLADAVVSAGVVAAGLLILLTGWLWVDPAVSLAVNAVIVWGTWSLLRDSTVLAMGAVPPGIEPAAVRRFLAERPGVQGLHDLHIWPISTTETALTAHLVMPGGHPGDDALMACCAGLRERFGIGHATLQVETDAATVCALAPETVV
ncbi:cation diffusion facilitator family transporter [Lichenibacterium dinghuense]|uniref:cation diffusion facilitator family transporter n=1 Tax=Lichenibacterium dinghuense TaxID=2895977 RepID=UPI001F183BB8|nr:cation diffusion facilitator family transporter [Lichenibacterium sp. 6Y81]